jgi:hypothetical protein
MIALNEISLTDFIDLMAYVISPAAAIGFFIAYKDVNVRWFLAILFVFHTIYEQTYDISQTWGEMYYVWGMFMNVMVIFLILLRKYIAGYFATGFKTKETNFLKRAYKGYKFRLQEGGIIALSAIAATVCFFVVLESTAYRFWWIDNLYFREYFYEPSQIILNILTAIAAIVLALNANGETNEYQHTS